MSRPITGIVLAGGASRRMGRDKRAIEFGGVPLIAVAVGLVASVADEVIVSCRRDDPPDPGLLSGHPVRLVFDARDGGPLAGLEAALRAASYDFAVVVPVDMPGLEATVLGTLVEAAEARPGAHGAVFETDSGVAPFPAALRPSILPILAGQLDGGLYRVRDFLRRLDLVVVGASVDGAASTAMFANLNAPDDLDRVPD
jgi:molybdopterin-guanine dinucleotide biosynthesis protein A